MNLRRVNVLLFENMTSTYDCLKNDDPDLEARERNHKMMADHPGVQLPSYCFWDSYSVGPAHTWQSWWTELEDAPEVNDDELDCDTEQAICKLRAALSHPEISRRKAISEWKSALGADFQGT